MSVAFASAWDLLKMRIPNVSDRETYDRLGYNKRDLYDYTSKDWINPFPETPKPENYGMSPFFIGQDFQHYSYRDPRSHGVTNDQGSSFVNVGTILAEIMEHPLHSPLPVGEEYKMTDKQIEDAIKRIATTGRHEAVHMALNTIFPYEGISSMDDFRRYQLAHEYGAHAGEYDSRLGALRGMARHPHFSEGGWDDAYAALRNPHRKRLRDLFHETEENRKGMS